MPVARLRDKGEEPVELCWQRARGQLVASDQAANHLLAVPAGNLAAHRTVSPPTTHAFIVFAIAYSPPSSRVLTDKTCLCFLVFWLCEVNSRWTRLVDRRPQPHNKTDSDWSRDQFIRRLAGFARMRGSFFLYQIGHGISLLDALRALRACVDGQAGTAGPDGGLLSVFLNYLS